MRYSNRRTKRNRNPIYREQFINRGVRFIDQFGTATINWPTSEESAGLDSEGYIWGLGDRYYKLAQKYYDDPKLWWVIAWFNQAPTEHHVEVGDIVLVPTNLNKVLDIFGV
jgi:hypothetical protein